MASHIHSSTLEPEALREWFQTVLPPPIRWTGTEGRCRCPFHDDRNPSMSVNVIKGTWHCFAGCGGGGIRDLARRLGVEPPHGFQGRPRKTRKMVRDGREPRPKTRTHEVEYVYADERGTPVLLVGRDGSGKGKRFAQYHWHGGSWWTGRGNAPAVPYRLPEVITAVTEGRPVYVVEGEKCADALVSHGLTATTNAGGAGKWPVDEQYCRWFRDADVVILPDNDEPGRKHARQVAHSLAPYAKRIRVVELPGLPEKGDVSDWLDAGQTVEELLALVEQAPEWKPEPGNVVALDGGKLDLDVRRRYWDGDTFVPLLLAQDVMSRERFVYEGGILYRYKDGVYKPDGEQVVKRLCLELLGPEFRVNRMKETLVVIEISTALGDNQRFDEDTDIINLANGLLRWRTLELLPHTPDYLSRIQLPVEFDMSADCPRIRQFLAEVLPDEQTRAALLEYAGYTLIPATRHQKGLLLYGPGGTGKSVLLALWTKLLGAENVSGVSIQELGGDKWKAAHLVGKLANINADVPASVIQNPGIVKALVTGDRMTAERKFGDPFEFVPYARLIFSCNELPATRDSSDAFYERWLIVPMRRKFRGTSQENKHLLDELTSPGELSGFLLLALEGLHRLEYQGRFTESSEMRELGERYRLDNDSVASFLQEVCEKDPGAATTKALLYERYARYCSDSGLSPLGKRRFGRRLVELWPEVGEERMEMARFWTGIRIAVDEQGGQYL